MRTLTSPGVGAHAGNRRGFTLPELMVAIVIITIGLLAMVSVSSKSVSQTGAGEHEVRIAALALSRFELLKSQGCASLTLPSNGTATWGGVTELWSAAKSSGSNTAFPIVAMTDSLQYSIVGQTRTRVYTTLRSCP